MNAVETGTLWGLIVTLIPGYRIKLGKPTLNKRQKRPIAAFIFFWLVTILGFVGMPLIWLSLGLGNEQPGTEDFTVAISGLIFSIVSLGLLGALPLNHCYAFYLELCEDHVRWRNWRWKERTFTYPSITFAHVENNGKNGSCVLAALRWVSVLAALTRTSLMRRSSWRRCCTVTITGTGLRRTAWT